MPKPTPDAGADGTISILGLEDTDHGRADRLSFRRREDWRAARTEIPAEELRARLDAFVTTMQGVIDSLPQRAGEFSLDEVTFSAEVSARGTVSLLGSGGELGGQAGITFTFTRTGAPEEAATG